MTPADILREYERLPRTQCTHLDTDEMAAEIVRLRRTCAVLYRELLQDVSHGSAYNTVYAAFANAQKHGRDEITDADAIEAVVKLAEAMEQP